jgi:hypothetical protein
VLTPQLARWTVYIVRCADGSLYTGIAKDVARRVAEHNSNGPLAANYTRARRPVVLVYREAAATPPKLPECGHSPPKPFAGTIKRGYDMARSGSPEPRAVHACRVSAAELRLVVSISQ